MKRDRSYGWSGTLKKGYCKKAAEKLLPSFDHRFSTLSLVKLYLYQKDFVIPNPVNTIYRIIYTLGLEKEKENFKVVLSSSFPHPERRGK